MGCDGSDFAPRQEEFKSLEGPPDITAYPMTEEQKARTYSLSSSWDARSGDPPPLGPMKGLAYFRRSAHCDSEAEFERYQDRLAALGPPVEDLRCTTVMDLLPETMKRMSFSSESSSSSSTASDHYMVDVYDTKTNTLAFHYQVGFPMANTRSRTSSRTCSMGSSLCAIKEDSVQEDTQSDRSAGSSNPPFVDSSTMSQPFRNAGRMQNLPIIAPAPKRMVLSTLLEADNHDELAFEGGSVESILSSFEVKQKREASNRRRLNSCQPMFDSHAHPSATHPNPPIKEDLNWLDSRKPIFALQAHPPSKMDLDRPRNVTKRIAKPMTKRPIIMSKRTVRRSLSSGKHPKTRKSQSGSSEKDSQKPREEVKYEEEVHAYKRAVVLSHQLDGAASLSSGLRRTDYDSQGTTLVNQQEERHEDVETNSPTLSDSSGGVPCRPLNKGAGFHKDVQSSSPTLSDSSGGVPCYPIQPSSWKMRQRCVTAIRIPLPQTPSRKVGMKEYAPRMGMTLFEEKEEFDLVETARIA